MASQNHKKRGASDGANENILADLLEADRLRNGRGAWRVHGIGVHSCRYLRKSRTLRDIAAYFFLMATYILFFYRFHAHDRLDTYAEHTDKFDVKKEWLAYVRSEDKVLFLMYGICAVATDLSGVITRYAPGNFIALMTMPSQGPWILFEKPILCTLISFAYSFIVACVIALVRSRKIYVEKANLKARKRKK